MATTNPKAWKKNCSRKNKRKTFGLVRPKPEKDCTSISVSSTHNHDRIFKSPSFRINTVTKPDPAWPTAQETHKRIPPVPYSPSVLAGSGWFTVLYPKLGDLKIPVMVYAFALQLMVLQSIFSWAKLSQSFSLVFTGAIFFMLSDSLLAINKFYSTISYPCLDHGHVYRRVIFLLFRVWSPIKRLLKPEEFFASGFPILG